MVLLGEEKKRIKKNKKIHYIQGGNKVTIREELSMVFESLLHDIERIDNKKIREKALQGLLTQTKYHLQQVSDVLFNINK